ncbi:sigma 54-interacting transcriptional regulator [Solidesulfovibrio sp. C21]|uniref:sigma 54-interacting transcriptional regulator n=1 Tax=Solidesulfovibrio sp. C21 TaxID=3398613 RepID=UPI0039FD98A3
MTANTPGLVEALGQSDAFLAFMERVAAVARVDRPVVLVGERGSGKELAAARLHFHSPRWEGPFVVVNPAALPRTLLESELFGHEAGAFTGAARRRLGRFEMADRGTLFLDELQAAPRAVQEKLLRAVEYGAIERIGAGEPVNVDARIVAATNVDPRELVRRGRLMPDLLDRLAFAVLFVPPLRSRHGDIAYLAERFAARFAAELGRPEPPRFTSAALAALAAHDWPGNIRELKNTVERAVFEAAGPCIDHVTIDPFTQEGRTTPSPIKGGPGGIIPPGGVQGRSPAGEVQEGQSPSWAQAIAAFETDLLRRALARAGGNQRRAADSLELTYDQFRGLYRKYAQALDAGRKAP